MTFKDYISQCDSAKMPTGSVVLTKEDCLLCVRTGVPGYTEVWLDIDKTIYSYILKPDSDILYTMDPDGNPKKSTVFSLKLVL